MESLVIAGLVTARIAATTWANVAQKRLLSPRGQSPLALFMVTWQWMMLLCMPWWLSTFGLGAVFWAWMLLTCLLEVPGNVLLLRSLRQTELSIFGPLSSIKPAISLCLAFVLFGERPTWLGGLGVLVILLGSMLLTYEPNRTADDELSRSQRRAGVRDRLLAVLLTALASVFLKQTLGLGSQWQVLAAWSLLSWLLALVWHVAAHGVRASAERVTAQGQRGHLLVACTMLIMQGCTIALFARMNVGYALALFQIGSLVSVLVGHRFFGEAHLGRRLFAASIMVAGAVIIILGK